MGESRSLGGGHGAWGGLGEPGESIFIGFSMVFIGFSKFWAGEPGEAWESLGNRFSLVFHWFSLVFLGFGLGRRGGGEKKKKLKGSGRRVRGRVLREREPGEGAGAWEEAGEPGEAWESLGNRFSLVFQWFSFVFP